MRPRVLVVATAASGDDPERPADERCALEWVSPLIVTPRYAELKTALGRLAEVRTIALTSAHAVDALVGALRGMGHDVRVLFGIKLAAVGPATAARLARYGLLADLVADGGGAALADQVLAARLADPVLHPRAADARPDLATALRDGGLRVDEVVAYEATVDTAALAAARRAHQAAPLAGIAFASPRGVDAVIEVFGGPDRLRGLVIGAIGATTADAVRAHGLQPHVADEPRLSALVACVADAIADQG